MNLPKKLQEKIEEAIPEASVQIFDPRDDGCHLEAIVISIAFEGKSLVTRHQMVMDAVKEYFSENLHALSLKTYTPNQYQEVENAGNITKN